jgi:hypothetical protein
MNTTKSVYNRLFSEDKVELEKHEVELALIDDFNKLLNQSRADYNEFNDAYNKFKDFQKLVVHFGDKYSTNGEKLATLYSEMSKKSKELGLNFSTTKEGKEALDLIATADPKEVKSLVNKAKTI